MEKKYKYILNMGLAFDEERVIKKLSRMAKEGWILKKMTLFRYKLVKGQPKDIVYSMDNKELDKNDDEYFQLFENSGWQHMCSYDTFHFFSAPPGTVPLYTDKENYLNKYSNYRKIYKTTAAISLSLIMLVTLIQIILGNKIFGTVMDDILLLIDMVSAGLAVPCIMVTIAFHRREKRILKNKTKII